MSITVQEQNIEVELLQKCLDTWGKLAQVVMVFEETAELNKELCKNLRGKDNRAEILDEIADVSIMLREMMILFKISPDEMQDRIRYKMARIRARLESYNGGSTY